MPRLETAAVPRRIPLVTNGDCGSFGIVFLLAVILASSSHFSTSLPVRPLAAKSTNIKWLSVPPETISMPRFCNPLQRACALSIIRFPYSLKLGSNASLKQSALAAITCIKGPPWIPGKIALFNLCSVANSSEERIIPPRGPRSVLCVVVVVTWAYGIGLSW